MSNHEVGTAALRVIARTILVVSVVALAAPAKRAGADVVLATGDELAGLGRIEVVLGKICVAPDGAILTAVHAEDGRDALVCIDGSGPRVVVRSGDPEPTGRTFLELQYGDCSFMRDGTVIFSATTLRPVVGPDGVLREWVEAAIYRAGPAGLTRVLGTGDQTNDGTVELWSSVDYTVSSAGTILAHVFVGGGDLQSGQILWGQHDWYLVTDAGVEIAFPSGLGWDDDGQDVNPGFPSLTEQGEFLAIGTIGYPLLRVSNALVEWANGHQRVVARGTELASDGVPYGAITDGFRPLRTGRGRLSVRGDTTVFAATAGFASRGEYQTRFFRYSPRDSTPQLVFAPAGPGEPSSFSPSIIDSNAGGAILLKAQGIRCSKLTTRDSTIGFSLRGRGSLYSLFHIGISGRVRPTGVPAASTRSP